MSYGSREFMLIGMECSQHKGYHISSDNLYVEVVDEQGRPAAPGETGRILVTDLHNDANPFIRYEIGDMGAMATEPCSCVLPFPLLARVEGRIQEYLLTADGSRLTALFIPHLMKEFVWVRGYQIEQEQPGKVRLNVLSDHEPTGAEQAPLIAALVGKLGEGAQVEVVRVAALKKGASGKVPIVVR
jgi:phenylacetate-CoA ligase